jgi:hypothetical protein
MSKYFDIVNSTNFSYHKILQKWKFTGNTLQSYLVINVKDENTAKKCVKGAVLITEQFNGRDQKCDV